MLAARDSPDLLAFLPWDADGFLDGLRHALFRTRLHARFLRPGLGELTGQPPPVPAPLRAADRAYRDALDELARRAGLAA